ncbi:MAG: outer membrane protein assembly factor BamE [Legionellales bacterium]|nr:outer membrane protein assembly factor BamE [Legionellales bacterium]
MRMKTILILISIVLSLTHCLSYDFSRSKVQQGNILSPARIAHLKLGMSKNDAAILMGTSLISPMFNQDRWDYAYTWRRGTSPNIIRHLTLFFSNDRLVKIDKDVSARKPT